jgi:hypothetical protein
MTDPRGFAGMVKRAKTKDRCYAFVKVGWRDETRCGLTRGHPGPCAVVDRRQEPPAPSPTGYQQTSMEAYEATRHAAGVVANRIRELYRDLGSLTDEALFDAYVAKWGGYRNTVLPCRNALAKTGEVVNTGRRSAVRSGRTAIVWELVDA